MQKGGILRGRAADASAATRSSVYSSAGGGRVFVDEICRWDGDGEAKAGRRGIYWAVHSVFADDQFGSLLVCEWDCSEWS